MHTTVEVVTMLGDSVVGVAHVEPAARAPSRRTTLAALGAGALLLLAAALSFGRGLVVAAEDQRALAHWRDVLGQPVHGFRPARLHPAHDWIALGGLAGGLALLSWGLARRRARPRRDSFTIGTDPGADASIHSAPHGRFPLVRWRGGAPVALVAEGMRARLHRAGRTSELDEPSALGVARPASWPEARAPGAREIDLPERGSLRVDIGPAAFVIRKVAASRPRAVPAAVLPDRRSVGFWLASAAAHMALLALLQAIPPQPASLAMGVEGPTPRRTTLASWKPSESPRVTDLSRDPDTAGGDRRIGGAPAAGGRDVGREARPGGGPMRPMPAQPGASSREEARRTARRSGMLAFLGSRPGHFDPLRDTGTFDTGDSAIDAYGTPAGAGPGATWGSFGAGPGGFGVPGGTVSSGRYGTIGWPGRPGPAGAGIPGPGLDPRRRPSSGGPTVEISAAQAVGGLDGSVIRRHIQRRRGRIRHCYERALLTAPGLEGTVVARFVISPSGAVLDASATGIDHGALASCIAGVIQGISFPRSTSGELARVTYPFELRNAGR